MPDPFPEVARLKSQRKLVLPSFIHAYFDNFGSKINHITVSIAENKSMISCFRLLSNLKSLMVVESGHVHLMNVLRHSTATSIREVIAIHRETFPKVLQHVSYLIKFSNDLQMSDTKVMIEIRDAMGGQWSTDTVELNIVDFDEPDLRRVLEDVELPRQLRVVKIICESYQYPPHWVQPIGIFLSRCRVLDSISFKNCLPRILSWAVNSQPVSASGVLGTLTKVNWKSVNVFLPPLREREVAQAPVQTQQLEDLWRILLDGFGHCMEAFCFKIGFKDVSSLSQCPTLSLSPEFHLPKLQSLIIRYPLMGAINNIVIKNLREFRAYGVHVQAGKGSCRQGWDQWSNLEVLRFGVNHLDPVGYLPWRSSQMMLTKVENSETSMKASSSGVVDVKRRLPNLKEVVLELHPPRLGVDFLLMMPNITTLVLTHNPRPKEEMNLTAFFRSVFSESIVFRCLRKIKMDIAIKLELAHFCRLIGFTSDGADSFPVLYDIVLGPMQLTNKLIMEEEHLFSRAVKYCMKKYAERNLHARGRKVSVCRVGITVSEGAVWETLEKKTPGVTDLFTFGVVDDVWGGKGDESV